MSKVNNDNNMIVNAAENCLLHFPVSLKTFMKMAHYEEAVDKYVKKKWGKTNEELAKQGLEKIYLDFYSNSQTRAECNVQIKACPKPIKDNLLQFAVTNDSIANKNISAPKQLETEQKVNECVSHIQLEKQTSNKCKRKLAEQTLRYPVSLKTFIKYTDHQKHVAKYIKKYWKENPQSLHKRTRTNDDIAKEGIEIIYRDFYRSSESRAKLNMRIKSCAGAIKNRLLQYAEFIEMDGEDTSQMEQCKKVKYTNQSNCLVHKPQSPVTTNLAVVEIVNPALTVNEEKSVRPTSRQTSLESWLAKSSRKKTEIEPINPPQIVIRAAPTKDVRSTIKSVEDETANYKIKDAAGMQNETSNNSVNKNVTETRSFPKQTLRYPVSLETFQKYIDHEWRVNKYVKKYWEKTPQTPPEITRTNEDVAQQAIKVLFKVFYRSRESREKLKLPIKPCPDKIKNKLLQYAEVIEVGDINRKKTSTIKHESKNDQHRNLNKMDNKADFSSENNWRYPNISSFKDTHVPISSKNMVKSLNYALVIKESTVESVKVAEVKESTTVKNEKVTEVKENTTVENAKAYQQATPHKCSTPQKLAKTHAKVTCFRNENSLTGEFLLNYIINKLGDSTKHAAEILTRIKNKVPCTDKQVKVHKQYVKILRQIEINTDLQEANELFFQKVAKHHTLPYIIRMNDGLKGDVLSAVLEMSFLEFSKYTRIHNAHLIYNDLPTLRRYYDFALIEQKIWPINLYMQINDLFEYLKLKGIQIKSKDDFSLAQISPKLLNWQYIMTVTNYDDCVLRYYEESVETLSNEDFANHMREDYYRKCWIHERWIEQISVLNSEAAYVSTAVDLNKTKTQLENDIEMKMEAFSQENIDMQSKDLNKTIQSQLYNDNKTALDTCSQENVDEGKSDTVGGWSIFRHIQLKENLLQKESQPSGKLPAETVAAELSSVNLINIPNTQVQIETLPTKKNVNSDPLSAERSTDTLRYLDEPVEILNTSVGKVKNQPLDNVLCMLDDGALVFPVFCSLSSQPAYAAQVLVDEELVPFFEAQRLPSKLEEQGKNKPFHTANKVTMTKQSALPAKVMAMPILNTNMPTKTITTKKTGELVSQLTHKFRALSPTKVPKNITIRKRYVTSSVTTPIIDTTSISNISTSTATSFSISQALAANCTLFESSQLCRAIEKHQIQTESVVSRVPQTTNSSSSLAAAAQQVNELNELHSLSQSTLIFRSLEKFHYFEQLSHNHIAKHWLQTAHLGERYMGAVINVNGHKTQLHVDCLNVIFPYYSPKLLADICLVLKSLRMYDYNVFEHNKQKKYGNLSDDMRERILCYLIDSTSIFLDSPVYLTYDSTREIGHCIPIVPNIDARRDPNNRPSWVGAIKPQIRNRIMRLKKNIC